MNQRTRLDDDVDMADATFNTPIECELRVVEVLSAACVAARQHLACTNDVGVATLCALLLRIDLAPTSNWT